MTLDGAVRDRLAELAERFDLSPATVAALARLLERVASDPAAPTTIRDPARAVDVHVADALVGLELAAVRDARRIADLGSGAGFPGLVLAAALPSAQVALVEASSRKCAFIARAIGDMGIANAELVAQRVEAWEAGRAGSDLVTARAVAGLGVLVEYAAPVLREGGALVAWKGRRDGVEERAATAAAAIVGLGSPSVHPVAPWNGAQQLHLHVYVKVGPTPNRFPRRPGIASKRPLRGSD